MKTRMSQRARSMRSSWRKIPGQIDPGQRFKVLYCDGQATTRIFGYTDDPDEAEEFVSRIRENPSFGKIRVVDRLTRK